MMELSSAWKSVHPVADLQMAPVSRRVGKGMGKQMQLVRGSGNEPQVVGILTLQKFVG